MDRHDTRPWGINKLPYNEYLKLKETVVLLLNHMGVDGETMQEILEEVGMDEQMHSQLNLTFKNSF